MKFDWNIKNASGQAPTQVLLYGAIGRDFDGSGNDPADFLRSWAAIPPGPIDLHIHSPGGYVFDGLAIYNAIATRRAETTAHVDGLAASTASWLTCAASKTVMPKTARMMIHDAQGFVVGDSETMRQQAEWLDKESDSIAQIYADKCGEKKEKMRDLMRAVTWMDGDQAKAIGLADEVTDADPRSTNDLDLSHLQQPGAGGGFSPANRPNTKPRTDPMNETNTVPAGQQPPPEEINLLKTALANERRLRIRSELASIAATRPQIDVAKWEDLAVDKPEILDQLRAMPQQTTEVVKPSGVTNAGNPLMNEFKALGSGTIERCMFLRNHLGDLHKITGFDPTNGNTLSSTLIPAFLAEEFIQTAQVQLAPLNAFSRDFGLDRMRPRATVVVAKHTSGPTVQTNATNFESGDSTLGVVSVTMNQYTASFHLDNAAQNQGFKLATLAQGAALNLAKAISDVWTALLATATYGADKAIGAASSFDRDDLPAILGYAKDWPVKNLVLDWGHLAYLLPKDANYFGLTASGMPGRDGLKPYGFDAIYANNRWTSAESNTVGVVCDPDALAVASGLPVAVPNNAAIATETATLQNGLAIQVNTWFSLGSRTMWASYDVMFGAAAGDTDKLEILVTS